MKLNINISKKLFNPVYLPYLEEYSRYEVFYGGAGSGKSVFVAQKIIYQHMKQKHKNTLIVRKVADTNRLSTFALIKQTINKWKLGKYFKVNESDLRIKCLANGNEIAFAGLDDVEKLKSITFEHGELTDIWIEEASEIDEADFNQLDLRLRGKTEVPKQIILSFNPVAITHWLKTVFFDNKKAGAVTLKTTYKDNQFIDDEYKRVLEAFRESDPYHYMVYCLGEWGVLGKTIFDAQKVMERISQLRSRKPLKEGFFAYSYQAEKVVDSTIKWVDEVGGYIRIYEDVKGGYPYVIGGDTAGEGSDNFTGQVIDNISGKQAATLRHQFDEDLYAKQMYCLGHYYNKALEAIETNYSTYPVKELERLGYPLQYVRETEDSFTHKLKKVFGFQTTKLTRPVAISGLVEIVREHTELINDIGTLEEMLTFVRNEKGKAEAQEGKHDDLIMGLAIAYYSRGQQRMSLLEKVLTLPKGKKIPQDLIDDYYGAPESERPRLLKKWKLS